MHKRRVRKWVFFLILLLVVFFARNTSINFFFSIWVGSLVMSKMFKYLFNEENETAELPTYKFIPSGFVWVEFLSVTTRRQTSYVVIWWLAGILATLATYNLLNLILIP